ncbi:MAG: helix-hairpin-helix domain-containing protein [Sulfurimonas sp.]|uniref:ComEA family DNA-binding protein n=1 Tax=Sulfurimonas sp. TaxID=2022749 RepID=UPI0025ED870F|nr:helix-hairpin-helix domain-containing protein [Sulfurimonas sp.]MCK9491499.1 helix-hairpin-helix domain-containing protein [Sulfurimonas sp.]
MKILAMVILGFSMLFAAIDINTASKDELSTLSGIGGSKAEMIVKHREAKCFQSVDELAEVKGIGAKTIEKNRKNLTASKCKK